MLPVTPQQYVIDRGVAIETVNLTGFGDVHLAGDRTLFSETLEFMLPVQAYPFNDVTAVLDPYYYIDFFELTGDNRQVCRFIVSDSPTQCEDVFKRQWCGCIQTAPFTPMYSPRNSSGRAFSCGRRGGRSPRARRA